MKYFGKKSLSSCMSSVLHVAWYAVILFTIIAPLIGFGVLFFSTEFGEQTALEVFHYDYRTVNPADAEEWEKFKNLPLIVKGLIIPYLTAISILLIQIIKKSRQLFANLKADIVFNKSNVTVISAISRLVAAFAILTFSFSSLLITVVLFLLCEIVKTGTTLQEEIELTI